MKRQRAFTLIELLVALFISAILFTMGYGAISQALANRQQLEAQEQRLVAVQQALRTMEQDLELMQPRPVRDLLGSGYLAPLVYNPNALAGGTGAAMDSTAPANGADAATSANGTASGSAASAPLRYASELTQALLGFTRGGWANPAGLPRSELQRVGYLLRDHRLVRQYLPVLDADGSVPLQERTLLEDVDALSFRFMDGSLTWQALWPTPLLLNGPAQDQRRARPVAIEITLKLKDWGVLTRVVEVAG